MEEKNMRELSMDELDKVSGGALTQKKDGLCYQTHEVSQKRRLHAGRSPQLLWKQPGICRIHPVYMEFDLKLPCLYTNPEAISQYTPQAAGQFPAAGFHE